MKCGKVTDSILDYTLINNKTICWSCVRYYKRQIEDLILYCAGCDKELRNFGEVAVDNDAKQAGFILCKTCFKASEIA